MRAAAVASRRGSTRGLGLGLALVLCGGLPLPAAAAPAGDAPAASTDQADHDPIEGFNRKIFWFNDKVDVYALEPAARAWRWIAPERVRSAVSKFFLNLHFPIVAVNDLLQGKLKASAVDVGRFGVNTTVGVLGFFDPASGWGLERHDEDFGQTLGVWGVPSGPYLVLPILGPSNPRDAGGLAVDTALSVTPFFLDWYVTTGARVFETINYRTSVLQEVHDAKESALDYYTFVRNAYQQRRKALVSDNAEPSTQEEDELYHPELGQ
jgi:phospholipid-binding lipoprotein MlaA